MIISYQLMQITNVLKSSISETVFFATKNPAGI